MYSNVSTTSLLILENLLLCLQVSQIWYSWLPNIFHTLIKVNFELQLLEVFTPTYISSTSLPCNHWSLPSDKHMKNMNAMYEVGGGGRLSIWNSFKLLVKPLTSRINNLTEDFFFLLAGVFTWSYNIPFQFISLCLIWKSVLTVRRINFKLKCNFVQLFHFVYNCNVLSYIWQAGFNLFILHLIGKQHLSTYRDFFIMTASLVQTTIIIKILR